MSYYLLVPPKEVIIMDEFGQRLRDPVGPFNEGAHLTVICEAEGGQSNTITRLPANSIISIASMDTLSAKQYYTIPIAIAIQFSQQTETNTQSNTLF